MSISGGITKPPIRFGGIGRDFGLICAISRALFQHSVENPRVGIDLPSKKLRTCESHWLDETCPYFLGNLLRSTIATVAELFCTACARIACPIPFSLMQYQ
jgi:hypothetical protein